MCTIEYTVVIYGCGREMEPTAAPGESGRKSKKMKTQNGREVELSISHSSSSYGIPVLIVDGIPHAAGWNPLIPWKYSDGHEDIFSTIGLAASACLPEQSELYEIFKNSCPMPMIPA